MSRSNFHLALRGISATLALVIAGCAAATAPVTHAGESAIGSATEVPAFEKVTFPSLDGDLTGGTPTLIDGLLFKPAGPGPFPAIVALHGCGGLWSRRGLLTSRDFDWGTRLRNTGYVVLFPDSFTPRGQKQGICSLKDRTIQPTRERPRDAYGALRFLQSQPFVRPDRVGLLGWSNGGSTVLASIAVRLPIRPADAERGFRTAVAFYPGCRISLERSWWKPAVPLSIFIGASDDWTPAEPCVELGERARALGVAMEVTTYPGAYHGFDAPNTPLQVRTGVATTASGQAMVGTHPEARRDAIERTLAIFRAALEPR